MRLRLGAGQHAIAVGIARPAAGGGEHRRGDQRGAQRQKDHLLFHAIHSLSWDPCGGMPGPDVTLLGAICPTSLPHKRNYVGQCCTRAAGVIRAHAPSPIRAQPPRLAPPPVYYTYSTTSE